MTTKRCFQCKSRQGILSTLKGSLSAKWRCIGKMDESAISNHLNKRLEPYDEKERMSLFLCGRCVQKELKELEEHRKYEQVKEQEEERKKKNYLEWIEATPQAKKLLHEGPEGKVDQEVFQWLTSHKGRRVHAKFETTEGAEYSESTECTIGDPYVDNLPMKLIWEMPFWRLNIQLPVSTYAEVEITEHQMIFRIGYANYWEHGSVEGLTSTSQKEKVDVWNIYIIQEHGLPPS